MPQMTTLLLEFHEAIIPLPATRVSATIATPVTRSEFSNLARKFPLKLIGAADVNLPVGAHLVGW